MNPASIKANMRWLKPGTTIIFDIDSMNEKALEKAGYESDPTQDDTLSQYKVVKAPITSMTLEALKDFGWDRKAMLKSKNMFALGIVMYLFNRDITMLNGYFNNKFKNKPEVVKANQTVVAAGYSYADTMEIFANTYRIEPANLAKANIVTSRETLLQHGASWPPLNVRAANSLSVHILSLLQQTSLLSL